MEPAIRADDLVIVHRQETYSAGDVIMFRSGANTTTHRVTEVTAEGYRTKGDANNTADADTVPPADVLGRVVLTLHGAGDVFTSALCGELLCGKAPMDALDSAADFCDRCIHETVKRQPWHWYGLAFEPVLKGNHV